MIAQEVIGSAQALVAGEKSLPQFTKPAAA
jgi:hypothetical protein